MHLLIGKSLFEEFNSFQLNLIYILIDALDSLNPSIPTQPHSNTTATMSIPLSTITSFRTTFNPFTHASRPCRLFLSLLRTPGTTPTSSPTHIDIKVKQLPRNSTEQPVMTVGFKGGKELTLEVGKRGLKIGDVVEEVSRVGRFLEREASLKG